MHAVDIITQMYALPYLVYHRFALSSFCLQLMLQSKQIFYPLNETIGSVLDIVSKLLMVLVLS